MGTVYQLPHLVNPNLEMMVENGLKLDRRYYVSAGGYLYSTIAESNTIEGSYTLLALYPSSQGARPNQLLIITKNSGNTQPSIKKISSDEQLIRTYGGIYNSELGIFNTPGLFLQTSNAYELLIDPYANYDEAYSAVMNSGPIVQTVPITYYPTGCVLQGPSEAEQGDTVNVLVTPGPGKIIKPESIQVYDRSGLITHTYSSGILSFNVPDGQ